MTKWFYFFLFLFLIAARAISEIIFQPRQQKHPATRKTGFPTLIIMLTGYSIAQTVSAIALLLPPDIRLWSYCSGTLLFVAGSIGRFSALKTLGSSYSTFIDPGDASLLVTTGLYKLIRHPLYIMYILEMAGFLLIRFHYLALLCSLLVIGAIIVRIPAEEKALAKRFGMSFVDYRQRTKMLLPFLL